MKKLQLMKLISGSLIAKIITGVVATTVATGGAVGGVVIHNNNVKKAEIVKQQQIQKEKKEKEEKEKALSLGVEGLTDKEKEDANKVFEESKEAALKEGKSLEEANSIATQEQNKKVNEVKKGKAPAPVKPTGKNDGEDAPKATQVSSAPEQHKPAPEPKPEPKPESKPETKPEQPKYDDQIVVSDNNRNLYGGKYGRNVACSNQVSPKTSINYSGKWLNKMDETHKKLSSGALSLDDCKATWVGKNIDGKYKVVNVRKSSAVIPWTQDNVLPLFEAKDIWGFGAGSVHYDKTYVYMSNTPDYMATRLVIDLEKIN